VPHLTRSFREPTGPRVSGPPCSEGLILTGILQRPSLNLNRRSYEMAALTPSDPLRGSSSPSLDIPSLASPPGTSSDQTGPIEETQSNEAVVGTRTPGSQDSTSEALLGSRLVPEAVELHGAFDNVAVVVNGRGSIDELGHISDYRLTSFDFVADPPVEGAYPRITDAAWVRGGCWTNSSHAAVARVTRIMCGGPLGELPSVSMRASWRSR